MHRYPLIAAAVISAAALGAPVASAQTGPFSATYTEHFVGPTGRPPCPDEAFACGSGTAAGFGAFTAELSFDETCNCVVRTLTFSDRSMLVLGEHLSSFTARGGSGSANARPSSEGHPGTYVSSWTVDSGTGSLAGATGSGTDTLISAGLIGMGTLGGPITTPAG